MTVRSTIEIDVNDDRFKAFMALYKKYEEGLKRAGGVWENVEETTAGIGNNFAKMTAALMAQHQTINDMNKAEEAGRRKQAAAAAKAAKDDRERTKSLDRQRKQMSDINKSAGKFAKNTGQALINIVKMASIGTIAGGLLGGGGLFGLDAMAGNVGDARRSAQGLGVSVGEQRAFGLAFGRYVDPSNLNKVADAQNDVSQRWAFSAMGVNPTGKDPAQLAAEMALRARDMYSTSAHSKQYADAHGLSQFYSMEELRRLNNTPRKELSDTPAIYANYKKQLEIQDKVAKQWQDFSVQMDKVKYQLESVFVNGLTKLIGPLSKLSDEFTNAVTAFVDSPQFGKWVSELATNIESFAKYMGSDDFKTKLDSFLSGIDLVGKEIFAVADRLKWLLPKETAKPVNKKTTGEVLKWFLNPLDFSNPFSADDDKIKGAGNKYGVPAWLLHNIYGQESAFGLNAGPSIKGALGPFQFMPKTAQQYGLDDPKNFDKSLDAAGRYLRDLLKEFNGDYKKAAAAYNWGQGNVEKDIKAHGSDWENYLPNETKDYLVGIGAEGQNNAMWAYPKAVKGAGSQVNITVHNATGGSAVVSTSQVAK